MRNHEDFASNKALEPDPHRAIHGLTLRGGVPPWVVESLAGAGRSALSLGIR